jgi:hypothetical protein
MATNDLSYNAPSPFHHHSIYIYLGRLRMFLFNGSLFDIALANLAVVVGGMLDRPSLATDCHVRGDLYAKS